MSLDIVVITMATFFPTCHVIPLNFFSSIIFLFLELNFHRNNKKILESLKNIQRISRAICQEFVFIFW